MKDGSSPAVSCLKLEPKVSSFPVLEANVASSTNATAKSPFIWACVYEGVVKRLDFICSSKGRQQIFGFMPVCYGEESIYLGMYI